MLLHRTQAARLCFFTFLIAVLAGAAVVPWLRFGSQVSAPADDVAPAARFRPRQPVDTSGFFVAAAAVKDWGSTASLDDVAAAWRRVAPDKIAEIDKALAAADLAGEDRVQNLLMKAMLLNYQGRPKEAYEVLEHGRTWLQQKEDLDAEWLYTVIYFQGVTALRRGENDNCVLCRGECSCILPIAPSAVHTNPAGSRLAIQHFTEYLEQFPDDLEVRWLLNVAHMTLGEYPGQGRSPLPASPSTITATDEFDIGKFRDVSHRGGRRIASTRPAARSWTTSTTTACSTSSSPSWTPPSRWPSTATRATARSRTAPSAAGLSKQLGGLNCVQADYNNDGHLDIFILRGAWLPLPDAAEPAAEQRRRHLHRRHRGGGPARPGQLDLPPPGPTTTTTASSTCSSAASGSPTACTTTRATAPSRRSPSKAGVQGDGRPLQGGRLDRLRQRRLPRPVPQLPGRPGPALPQQPRRHLHRRHRGDGHRRARPAASPAGPGTTTTTAGSTSSPPPTTAPWRTWSRACWASRTQQGPEQALPQPAGARASRT